MKTLRHPTCRLAILALYVSALLIVPGLYLPALASSCPMTGDTCSCCNGMGDEHECSCENCSCKMSSSDEDVPELGAAGPGVLRAEVEVPAILETASLVLTAPDSTSTPCLSVLTPPPKSRLS